LQRLVIRIALIALALLLGLAAPASAAKLTIGIGEQNPTFFDDPRWLRLDKPHVRFVVAWNALHSDWQTAELDRWMEAARRRNARVLITFGHARGSRERYLPTRDDLAREFRALRRRYPDLQTFQAWNEANHGTQPTRRRPDRVARYYDMMLRNCPRCNVVAPSVLDMDNMLSWIKRFRRVARRKVRVWSIHNHIDANRFRTTGTRKLLRHTRGKIWFTETGGIANRWIGSRRRKEYTRKNAAKATRQVFRLARLSRRVTRVYFYHWVAPPQRRPRWDSGFIGPKGHARPAFSVLRRQVRFLER
jgi:hypothetical protein